MTQAIGALFAAEASDVLSVAGTIFVPVIVGIAEVGDAPSFAGYVSALVAVLVSEDADAFSASVLGAALMLLAVMETQDTVAAIGNATQFVNDMPVLASTAALPNVPSSLAAIVFVQSRII